jgi:hypothetical protein
VKQDNDSHAGAFLFEDEKILVSRSVGVRDGNIAYVEKGALTASYYLTIEWAKDQGYDRIDFGYCRPFLRDGVFTYKKRWGMKIENQERPMGRGAFGLKICRFSKSVRSFLAENPLVFVNQDKLKGLIVTVNTQPLAFKDVQRLVRTHNIEGLDELIILSPQGFTRDARKISDDVYPQLLQLMDMDLDVFFERRSIA